MTSTFFGEGYHDNQRNMAIDANGGPTTADFNVRDFNENLDDELLTTVLPQNMMKVCFIKYQKLQYLLSKKVRH